MKNLKSIKRTKYFKDLDDQDFQAFLRCISASIKTFYKDEIIVHDGDTAGLIYIILSGSARSYYLDIDGNRTILDDYGKDSIFGISYYTSNAKHVSEFLQALEDTTIIICDAFRFLTPCQNRCRRHTECMRLTFNELTRQILSSRNRIDIVCKSKTRDKVISYLKKYKAQTKKPYFTVPHNRQEMADYLGVERSSLSYELSQMKKDGIIDYDKNSFKIIKKLK